MRPNQFKHQTKSKKIQDHIFLISRCREHVALSPLKMPFSLLCSEVIVIFFLFSLWRHCWNFDYVNIFHDWVVSNAFYHQGFQWPANWFVQIPIPPFVSWTTYSSSRFEFDPILTDSFHKLKQYKLMKRLVKQPFAI